MHSPTKFALRSLTIHRYEQFRDCPPMVFSTGDNLLLGVNGSGKTSLLQLLAAVLRCNYNALLGQAFDIEFDLQSPVAGAAPLTVTGRVTNQPERSQLWAVGPRRPSESGGLRARFEVQLGEGESLVATVAESRLQVAGSDSPGHELYDSLAMSLALAARDEAIAQFQSHCQAVFAIRETDVDFAHLTEVMAYRYDGWIELVPPGPQSVQWIGLLGGLMPKLPDDSEQPMLAYHGKPRDTSAILGALDAADVRFRLKIEHVSRGAERDTYEGKGVEVRVRFNSGTRVSDARLTFGQRRLLTIGLGALLSGASPMLIDEIDNGLHPALVEAALTMLDGRQTFIASHNKLVVDMLDYNSPEDLQRKILICSRDPDGAQRVVQLSQDEAREVFEQVQVGLMNPSDVLRIEGLW